MAEDWKLQVSIRTSLNKDADMINVRANTIDELSILLEGIADYSTQIAATAKMVTGAYIVNPLVTAPSTQGTTPPPYSAPPQAQAPSSTAPTTQQQGGPVCQHGPRKYKSGISSKTGNPYAMWVCPMPQGVDQCKPVN